MNMNFDSIKNIGQDEITRLLLSLCDSNTELFLVGGYIRDLLLEKDCYDKDYAIKGASAREFAQKVAEIVNGYYVLLDDEFDIARVVMPDKKNTLDFASCYKQDIIEDIKRRDYTINAIACKIDNNSAELIDIVNGIDDLKNHKINAISEENLVDDPLRLLRAFRFAAQFDFDITDETLEFIKKNQSLINNVAMERINAELIKLFEADFTAENLILMKETGFLDVLFPELIPQRKVPPNLHHHLGLIDHSIEVVRQIELQKNKMPAWFQERLTLEPSIGIKIISLLKIAGLFHDLGKPQTWQIDEKGRHRFIKHEEVGANLSVPLLKRLKFSKSSIKYISGDIKFHLYPSQLASSNKNVENLYNGQENALPSEKAIFRMFRKIGVATPDVILLAMADRLSARGPEITDKIVDDNIKSLFMLLDKYKDSIEQVAKMPKFLDGNDLMALLNLEKGPVIGKILASLHEAQISGDILDKEQAIDFVRKFYIELNKES